MGFKVFVARLDRKCVGESVGGGYVLGIYVYKYG